MLLVASLRMLTVTGAVAYTLLFRAFLLLGCLSVMLQVCLLLLALQKSWD
jgi:hypothetical protein